SGIDHREMVPFSPAAGPCASPADASSFDESQGHSTDTSDHDDFRDRDLRSHRRSCLGRSCAHPYDRDPQGEQQGRAGVATGPRREDIQTIALNRSGPIIIGQACEFDYSGTEAVRALKEEGYRVVLVNSSPATIMADPGLADRTYIEPITAEWVERIIEKERLDALLPTMGGQTALNVALELNDAGVVERYGVELVGGGAR